MKRSISLLLLIMSCFMLVGCHKNTEDEQSVIDCLEAIEKDIDDGIERKDESNKLKCTSYYINGHYQDCKVLTSIGSKKDNEVDKATAEYKVEENVINVKLNLARDYDESVWKEKKQIIKDTLEQYKKDIKNRD
ncbi:MAG: hypothetical protein GX309_11855 [Clostridiales bacterium]|nr:hypothetical protein [Clostridiales bacterium]